MTNRQKVRVIWLLVGLLALLLAQPTRAAAPRALQCGGWSIVPSPNPTNYLNVLNGVAAVSATDVWAVGYDFASNGLDQTLTEHWNGTSWQVVPSANVASSGFSAITAVSSNDIWAVGYKQDASQTLVEHWDGSQWSIIPSPSVGNFVNSLTAVSALSPDNIWAVGASLEQSGASFHTLIEHWDGNHWSVTPSPNVGSDDNSLSSVVALSSTNVWAVGGHSDRQAAYTLTEHWDGTKWSIIHAPGGKGAFFTAAAAIDATHVWAVGRGGHSFGTLTERWHGSRWRIVPSPSPGYDNDILYGVAGSAPDNVWTVGRNLNPQTNMFETLTEHWNGTSASWQVVASPNVPSEDNYLNGVAMTTAHTAWAVGYSQPHNGYTGNTLIEYYC